jgi:hypothetical protein
MRDRPDSTALLEEIRVPTLVVGGAEDELTRQPWCKRWRAAFGEPDTCRCRVQVICVRWNDLTRSMGCWETS